MPKDDVYLEDHAYRALVAALTAIEPDPATGKVEEHQLIEILGELGGIWPAAIRAEGDGENDVLVVAA